MWSAAVGGELSSVWINFRPPNFTECGKLLEAKGSVPVAPEKLPARQAAAGGPHAEAAAGHGEVLSILQLSRDPRPADSGARVCDFDVHALPTYNLSETFFQASDLPVRSRVEPSSIPQRPDRACWDGVRKYL